MACGRSRRPSDGLPRSSPAKPTVSYIVSGTVEAPTCTCPDFEHHKGNLNFHCLHITTVLNQLKKPNGKSNSNRQNDEALAAIQNETGNGKKPAKTRGVSQMVIKRSVSPDGHIDSLSVEFALPVKAMEMGAVTAQATEAMKVQSEIVKGFLINNGNGKGNGNESGAKPETDSGVLAQMLDIAGMNSQWGRRLFINVQMNGKALKFFGNKKQLAESITAIGFPDYAENIAEGVKLNLPCRVLTERSKDGKYLNVAKVLPIELPRKEAKP